MKSVQFEMQTFLILNIVNMQLHIIPVTTYEL